MTPGLLVEKVRNQANPHVCANGEGYDLSSPEVKKQFKPVLFNQLKNPEVCNGKL